jgi:hypothetical protein
MRGEEEGTKVWLSIGEPCLAKLSTIVIKIIKILILLFPGNRLTRSGVVNLLFESNFLLFLGGGSLGGLHHGLLLLLGRRLRPRKKHLIFFLCRLLPEAGSLNKCSCLAPASGVTKLKTTRDMILVTLCCAT